MIVSIIVPVYNEEKNLPSFIQRIEKYKNIGIEVIFINDGSSDSSEKIIQSAAYQDSRIQLISITNSGVSVARNRGLEAASGQWIFFADADDEVEFCNFDAVIDILERCTYNIVQCNIRNGRTRDIIEERPCAEMIGYCLNRNRYLNPDNAEIVYSTHGSCGKFYRLCHLRNHQICFDDSLKLGEDMKFYLEALMYCESILVTDIPVYHIKNNPNSSTRRWNPNLEKSAIGVSEWLKQTYGKSEYCDDMMYQIFNHLCVGVIPVYSYPENTSSLWSRRKALSAVIREHPVFRDSIAYCCREKKKYHLTRNETITAFLLKAHSFFLLLVLKRFGVVRYQKKQRRN